MTDGGIYKSTNSDELRPDFKQVNRNFSITQFYGIGAGFKGNVLGGTQDNSTPFADQSFNSLYSSERLMGGDGGWAEISDIKTPSLLIGESQFWQNENVLQTEVVLFPNF